METTKGYKTSEFWMSLGAVLLGALMSSGILDDLGTDHWLVKVVGLVVSVLGALGYTAARGMVKASASKAAAIGAAVNPTPPSE